MVSGTIKSMLSGPGGSPPSRPPPRAAPRPVQQGSAHQWCTAMARARAADAKAERVSARLLGPRSFSACSTTPRAGS
eukprot:3639499-Prymnesium_polylepis.1